MTHRRHLFAVLSALVFSSAVPTAIAHAQESTEEATAEAIHREQLEQLRAKIANQIQLRAFDLVDELVFGWLEAPPFATRTPLVLADVIAPVGYGTGLEAMIENHLAQVLISNPQTNIQLAHCPSCNTVVVHSDAKGTVIARGVDQPKALAKLRGRSGAEHALFLDFEAEGTALVLRARITKLDQALPIVYARTLSSQTASAPLLRSPTHLVSAEQARQEYLAILEQRGPIKIPLRLTLGIFAPSSDAAFEVPIPIPWGQVGIDLAITSSRTWIGSLTLGASFVPEVHVGGQVQARIYRLLTGTSYSLTHPNIYGFFGSTLVVIQGQTAGLLDSAENASVAEQLGPVAAYPSLQTGVEVRISDRIAATVFAETMPTLYNAEYVGDYINIMGVEIHSIGAEATFAF